ncbi:hypothetical protein [Natronococcus occultus]|uniref:Uncharacterized protein n=1 Tax=Natronococcus occultus SP4 TaxID=694430 RepID=L0K0P0_9EURY|nr:hypothetical protein [Natronococcus occultus]AGB37904.1 hypothetical protein Natoc_2119 [Natronococcus occultus SP4]
MVNGGHRTNETGGIEVEIERRGVDDTTEETVVRTFATVDVLESGWIRGTDPLEDSPEERPTINYHPPERVLEIRSSGFAGSE